MLFMQLSYFFFFNDTATTEIYTLSLHDALPICLLCRSLCRLGFFGCRRRLWRRRFLFRFFGAAALARVVGDIPPFTLELNRGFGDLLFQTTTALPTPARRFVRQLLKDLRQRVALLTAKFVNRHY